MKKVNLTPCKSSCTKVFTLWPRMFLEHKALREAKPRSGSGKTAKTGGSDPTFSAFSRPKSAWGRSRPIQHDATIALSRPQATAPKSSKARMAMGPFNS